MVLIRKIIFSCVTPSLQKLGIIEVIMPCLKNSPLLCTKKLTTGFTSNSKQHLGTTNLVEFNMKIPYSFTNDDERLRWERRSMAIVSSIDNSMIQDNNKLQSHGIETEHNDKDDRSTESNIQKITTDNATPKRQIKKTRSGRFSSKEDDLIIYFVKQYGDNIETFKLLAGEFIIQRKYTAIKDRYAKICSGNMNNDTSYKQRNKPFSKTDDIEILRYVECYGNSPKVFHALALELQRDHWTCVRTRYYRIKQNPGAEIKDRAAYSEEEDKLILEYIEKYGNCKDAYDRLCQELQRNINSVRARRNLLTKRYLDRKTEWKIEEDEALMKSILQVRNSTILQNVQSYSRAKIYLLNDGHIMIH